ncbi:6498_t:CDS:2, partial [Scutellospora calospora]
MGLKEWFSVAISSEEFNEIRYDDLGELVLIGRGAFGEVYSASFASIKNTVAVKRVLQSYLDKHDVFDAFIKEPVYNPPSQLPVNESLNTLLSSISTKHNSTLIFDESLAVPFNSNRNIPPDYGNCKRCGNKLIDDEWCNNCESENFRENFGYWTSGNQQIDELIQESQLKAINMSNYIEWIEIDQLEDIELIGKGGFSTVYSAVWRDGAREEWDEETGRWERASNTKVAVAMSDSADSSILKEIKLHVCCDKAIRCYGITRYSGKYGLVKKYANYGSLYSFNVSRTIIGWWQKLKILEGIILGLNQIHLKAGYCHGDLHSGNILIDQDELSVSVFSAHITDFGSSIPIDS